MSTCVVDGRWSVCPLSVPTAVPCSVLSCRHGNQRRNWHQAAGVRLLTATDIDDKMLALHSHPRLILSADAALTSFVTADCHREPSSITQQPCTAPYQLVTALVFTIQHQTLRLSDFPDTFVESDFISIIISMHWHAQRDPNMAIILSVRLSVCHILVMCLNESTLYNILRAIILLLAKSALQNSECKHNDKQEAQLMLTNMFRGQSRHQTYYHSMC